MSDNRNANDKTNAEAFDTPNEPAGIYPIPPVPGAPTVTPNSPITPGATIRPEEPLVGRDEPMDVEEESRGSRIIWVWVALAVVLLIFAFVIWQR
jgi:hypothetical protein